MYRITHEQFLKKLSDKNKNFTEGVFTVEDIYNGDSRPVLLKNKYGLCKSTPNNLYKGIKPNISSAVDKTSYFINMAKEMHGDKYAYDNVVYNGYENKVEIICPIHGDN